MTELSCPTAAGVLGCSWLDLTPGNLITHLRKLEDAGYLVTEKSDAHPSTGTSVALTRAGRQALDDYTATLRGILDGV